MTGLPRGWAWSTIGEACEVVLGQSPPGSSYNENGEGMPFFQGKAEFGEMTPTVRKWTTRPSKLAREGDVLISVRAPVGPTNLAPAECAIGRGLAALRPRAEIEPRYLLYWMRASESQLASRGTGSTFAAVSGMVLRSHRIPVAPLAEQRRIVAAIEEHLSRLDAAHESLGRARRNLGVLRTRAIEGALCSAWPWTTLGEIAEIVGGVTKDAKRQSDPSFVEVPYLRVANVQRGFLDLTEVSTIRVPPDKAKALELRPGDVLFNEGGDRDKLGRGWIWSGEIEQCIHQNHVFRARLRGGFEPKFVSWHGNTFGRRWFEDHGRQTTNLASLNLTTLKSFPVPAPTIEDQRRVVKDIERELSIVDAMAVEIDRALGRSAALRRVLLEQAFTGKLVPQNSSDEPAALLLDRIAADRAVAPKPSRRTARIAV